MKEVMKKTVWHLGTLLKGILFIGFSIQIILGLVWMCFNFAHVQAFGEPEGFLYPLLLRIFGSVPQIIYLSQLSFAWFSATALLKPVVGKGGIMLNWCVLALLTLPFSLQCHLALLPYSFVCSFLFLEAVFCRSAMRGERGVSCVELAKGAACWIVLTLLLPEYGWLGGIPLALTVLFRISTLIKQLRQLAYCLLIIAAFGGMIMSLDSLRGFGEGKERSFWFSMAHRIAWPTVWNDSGGWPEELSTIVTDPVLWEASQNSGNMERLLKPVIENAVDAEEADVYYHRMVLVAWQWHSSVIIRQMALDVCVYVLPQAILPLQLEGRGYDSFSGRNYEIMLGKQPRITRYYIDYSCWWFIMAFGTALLLTVLCLAVNEKQSERKGAGFLIVCVLSAGAVTLYYVMRGAGMSDYKCTLAVSAVWTVWMIYCMRQVRRDDSKQQ